MTTERSRSRRNVIDDLHVRVNQIEDDRRPHPLQFSTFDDWHIVGNPGQPVFQSGWSSYLGGFAPVGFWKSSAGMVILRGLIEGGSSSSTMFTLPAGFRPVYALLFGVHATGGEGRVDIWPDGQVRHVQGANNFIQLDGINFRAEA